MKSVAIDIGSYSIKVVELESKKSRNFKICEQLEIPIAHTKEDEYFSFLEGTIKKIAHHYLGQSVRFIFAISQEHISAQYCSFPIKERHKIVKSLPFQLADEVPFNSNNVIYEAKYLATVGNSTELLAVIVNKKKLAETLEIARECGIEPYVVGSSSIALSNLFSNWSGAIPSLSRPIFFDSSYQNDEDPTPAKVLIDIGHKTTNIIIYINNFLVQCNTIFFGGADIIDALSSAYELKTEDAQKHLEEKGFVLVSDENASKNQIFFSDVIKKSVQTGLIKPVNKIFLSASSKKQLGLESINLLGGVSRLSNLTDYLTDEFKIQTSLMSEQDGDRYRFANAIALAIEGLRTPKNPPVNFIKGEFSPKNQFFYNLFKVYGKMFKVAVACLFLLFIHGIVKGNFASSLSDSGYQELQKLAKSPSFGIKKPSTTKINRFIKNKTRELESVEEMSNIVKSKSAMGILEDLSSSLPDKRRVKLDVKKLKILNDRVDIQGLVDNQNQNQTLLRALQSISKGKKVNRVNPNFTNNNPNKVAFAYTFTIGNE